METGKTKILLIILPIVLTLVLIAAVFLATHTGHIFTIRDDLSGILLSQQKKVIIDLRDNPDYEITHIESSVNIPLDDEGEWLLKKIPEYAGRFTNIILVCYSGKRAATGYNLLKKAGYFNVNCVVAAFEDICKELGYENLKGAEICDCYKKH